MKGGREGGREGGTAVHAGNDRGTANRTAYILLHASVADRSGGVRAAS
jgi:hypothetical protein